VSVRDSLLAILTVGPAYGFQLHGELRSRTAGRRSVNVGQIYGTLDRLMRQGAVASAGATDDGLPLYRLTDAGRTQAESWIHGTDSAPGEEWNDLVSRVLLACSLPGVDAFTIIARNRAAWAGTPDVESVDAAEARAERAAAHADVVLSRAALAWLDEVEAELRRHGPAAFRREFSQDRPRRGRRPATSSYVASA
jgi:DNA-binding PadR family transcriptional regulator